MHITKEYSTCKKRGYYRKKKKKKKKIFGIRRNGDECFNSSGFTPILPVRPERADTLRKWRILADRRNLLPAPDISFSLNYHNSTGTAAGEHDAGFFQHFADESDSFAVA